MHDQRDAPVFAIEAPSSRILAVNVAACVFLGYSMDRLRSMSLKEFLPVASWSRLRQLLDPENAAFQAQLVIPTRFRDRKGTELPADMTVRLDRRGGGRIAIAIVEDRTPQIELDRLHSEERDLRAELLAARPCPDHRSQA